MNTFLHCYHTQKGLWARRLGVPDKTLNDVVTFTLGIFVGLAFAYHQIGSSRHLVNQRANSDLALKLRSGSKPEDVMVLCWILTGTKNHKTKAAQVKKTWGPDCDKLLFMSSTNDSDLPTIALKGAREGKEYLWPKTKRAFKYVYDHYFDQFDWFMKADDNTFVNVKNLKRFLSERDTNEPVWFGSIYSDTCQSYTYNKCTWMAGGSGYVLSKEALKRFVEVGLKPGTTKWFHTDIGEAEDVSMANYLHDVGVKDVDARDRFGRQTFFQFIERFPQRESLANEDYPECCSDRPISFHSVDGPQQAVYDYLTKFVDLRSRRGSG